MMPTPEDPGVLYHLIKNDWQFTVSQDFNLGPALTIEFTRPATVQRPLIRWVYCVHRREFIDMIYPVTVHISIAAYHLYKKLVSQGTITELKELTDGKQTDDKQATTGT